MAPRPSHRYRLRFPGWPCDRSAGSGRQGPHRSPFPGKWNDGLLTTGNTEELAAATPARGDRIEAILGFAAIRAARMASVEWQGPPWDRPRLDGSVVGASLNGPEAGQFDCRP